MTNPLPLRLIVDMIKNDALECDGEAYRAIMATNEERAFAKTMAQAASCYAAVESTVDSLLREIQKFPTMQYSEATGEHSEEFDCWADGYNDAVHAITDHITIIHAELVRSNRSTEDLS